MLWYVCKVGREVVAFNAYKANKRVLWDSTMVPVWSFSKDRAVLKYKKRISMENK